MLLAQRLQRCAPDLEGARPASIGAAEGDHLRAIDGVARDAIWIANGHNPQVVHARKRPRQMPQRWDAPVRLVRAEAGCDHADSH